MVIDVLTLLFAGIAAIAALLGYLRSVAQGRAAGLRVERQGRDHVVICGGPNQATDVRIEFTSGGPVSHGELERPG